MRDTSLIEAMIHKQVEDLCFESIVSEAFIAGLPLPEDELTDGLTQRFAQYATECLKDLGSIELLKSALESEKNPMKRGYLQSMYSLCMETATDITSRILAENKDDKALKDAAANVTFTEGEYNRFSKAAATLTPKTLTSMIQKKALDTIKEEKEAFQHDQELEQELKDALVDKPIDDSDVDKETDTHEESEEVNEDLGGEKDAEGDLSELEDSAASPDMDSLERKEPENPDAENVAAAPESDMSGSYMFAKANEGIGDLIRNAFGKLRHGGSSGAPMAVPNTNAAAISGSRETEGDNNNKNIHVDLHAVSKETVVTSAAIFQVISRIASKDDVAEVVNTVAVEIIRKASVPVERIECFGARGNGAYGPDTSLDAIILTSRGSFAIVNVTVTAIVKALFMRINEIQLYGAPIYSYYLDVDCKTGEWEIRTGKTPLTMNVEVFMALQQGFRKKSDPSTYSCFGHYITLVGASTESFTGKAKDAVMWTSRAYEGWLGDKLAAMQAKSAERSQQAAIDAAKREEERLQKKAKSDVQRKKIDKWVSSSSPVLKNLLNLAKSKKLDNSIIASIQKAMNGGALSDVDYYNITIIDDISSAESGQNTMNNMMLLFALTGNAEMYNLTATGMNYYNGKKKQIAYGNSLQNDAFESFMESIAGKNYRDKHATVFSRLQELAYESILSTTERYTEIPFDTMGIITRQNTFGKFKSHWSKSVESMMDSIGRYAFESTGIDVPPLVKEEQLNSALLTASIIYTFFETLNSMNLYCPKLAEIKQFVDETLPIESRVELDKGEFMSLFKGIMSKAQASANKAMTVPEVDAIQSDLDIVRERCAAPGFETMRGEINARIGQVQESINARRDYLISKQKPKEPVIESATQLMRRERDTMKFSSFAGTTVAKPNVSYTKVKIDPQMGSAYVAVECYSADNRVVGKSTIVLEGATSDLPGYVQAAIEGSRLPELHKRVMITDKRSGKVLFDKNWYGR